MANKQGYNARLDESLGGKHRGPHKQSLKSRRDESKAMSKKLYDHPYGGDHGMKYEGVKKRINRAFLTQSGGNKTGIYK